MEDNQNASISPDKYLFERLEDQIDWYNKKSQWNQKWYKRIKNTETILSALIPFIMIFGSDNFYLKLLIALFGAIVAILSSVHGLYNFHENWIEYRSTSETLKHEKYMYLTKSGFYANKEDCFNSFVERVESIISHENINWAQLNKTAPKSPANHQPPK